MEWVGSCEAGDSDHKG